MNLYVCYNLIKLLETKMNGVKKGKKEGQKGGRKEGRGEEGKEEGREGRKGRKKSHRKEENPHQTQGLPGSDSFWRLWS